MWYKIIQLLFYPILQVSRAVGGVQLVAGTHCDGVIVAATWLHLSHISHQILQQSAAVTAACAHTHQHTACTGHIFIIIYFTHTHP